ncbi:hypothetical protein BDY24DRAFT_374655 [Mrakia frigida]|uniref:uncharacterized protein n=1 Tax=Mrakia frigida TaxID=29902 RepID=UPI003FCBF7C9
MLKPRPPLFSLASFRSISATPSPPRIYTSPHASIPSSLLPRTSLYSHLFPPNSTFSPSSPAFIDASTGKSLTRQDVYEGAGKVSRALRRRGGNEVVGIFLGNGLDWPLVFVGAQKAGWKTALLAGSLSPSDLSHQLSLSSPSLTITTPTLLPTLLQAYSLAKNPLREEEIKERIVLTSTSTESEGFQTLQEFVQTSEGEISDVEESEKKVDCGETSVICFSSGTEGLSKGVETTHSNLTSLLDMMKTPVYPLMEPGKDLLLGVLPFSHIYGLFKLILMPLQRGFPVVIVPKVDLKTICSAVETYKTTAAILVPPILIHLANSKIVDKYDMSSLKWLLSGAAPLGDSLTRAVEKRFAAQDLVLLQGFGLTETSPVTHILQLSDARSRPGSIGRLIPNVEARLVNPETGVDIDSAAVGEGGDGELWVRGPNVMRGYLNDSASTLSTFSPSTDGGDRWLKTGDIVRAEQDGYFFVVDRRKELIKYNGHQVAPAELEALLLIHERVADVGVIGVWKEEEKSEVPRAYIVMKPNTSLEEETDASSSQIKMDLAKDVEEWVRERVAPHKFLRGGVVVIEQIPKSPSGKILRRQLRDLAKEVEGGCSR